MAGSLQMACYTAVWFRDFQDLPVLAICACAVTILFSCCGCHILFLASSIRTVTALICCSNYLRLHRRLLLVLLVLLLLLLLWLRLLRPSRTDQARRNVLLDAFFQALCRPSNVALLTCTAEKVNDVTHAFCWKYVFLARVERSTGRKSADRLAVGKSINRSPVDPIPESSWLGAEPRKAYKHLVLFSLLTSAHRLAFQGLLYNTADNRSRVAILLKNRLQRLHFTIEISGAYTGGVHRCQWTPLEVSSFVSLTFKFNGICMPAHCGRARFRDRSAVFHNSSHAHACMRRSFNFQGSDRCRARKTV